jgi:hypothetical protein
VRFGWLIEHGIQQGGLAGARRSILGPYQYNRPVPNVGCPPH